MSSFEKVVWGALGHIPLFLRFLVKQKNLASYYLQGFYINEAEGVRTLNLRIDSPML